MLLYNVTIGIEKKVESQWLQWTKQRYIPLVMATNLFLDSKLYKVLHDDDDSSVSYSVQFFAESIEHVMTYLDKFEPAIGQELMQTFRDRHVAFRTLLEEV